MSAREEGGGEVVSKEEVREEGGEGEGFVNKSGEEGCEQRGGKRE